MSAPDEKRSYSCSTQKDLNTEPLPAKHTEEGERPAAGKGDDSIVVGIGREVPRWDVVKQTPRQLKYFVQASKFPSAKRAQDAAAAFQKAADLWNEVDLGVKITAAPDAAGANFDLTYWEPDDPRDTTLAMAFFPNEKNQTVWVYASALQPRNFDDLPHIFAHEIGHILGLRHEFAITGDAAKNLSAEGEGATQFMESNYDSVMSYNFPPTIQDTDKEGIKAFYKLKNGTKVGGRPVRDYIPTIKKR
ncbi:hypothetical protein KVR01_004572 [Diaporthe batatas]|uniref:uncharacterized protein n=1 Tax=Diaporthe batatas TaxID=748121 RepID=UPI001D03AA3C|nr:uncharacterized protein KVR01_004572 [Diaporthe batatas]KAG8166020.1 hypothetical protein KVR01_004572 [Diaporthe batatas]